ncbi:hypothetical protein D0860_07798 [Hortaea werneckii]|uniref:Zn(2)-C6 fungal-type domain-containing protein n=1 Tax=Hortaea werneckii TaxID=91943 RepID=A0A3M7GJR0_HORWE|nr:hypothetical protein D0860_07798 [Hortaea werneckii]
MHAHSQPSSAHHPPQPPQPPANQPSPTKRKPSETAAETDAANGNNSKKQKRRKVNHACVYCRRSHMTCDLERPCTRCVKRDIGHLCHDEPREGPKRTKSDGGAVSGADVGGVAIAPAPTEEPERSGSGMMGAQMDGGVGGAAGPGMHFPGQGAGGMPGGNGINGTGNPVTAGQQGLPQPDQLSPAQLQRPQPPPPPPPAANMASGAPQTTNPANLQMNNFDWNNNGNNTNSWNQFQDMHHLHPNYMFNTSEVTNEYNLLNDFLSSSLLDDGAMYSTDDAQTLFNDPLLSTSSINALSQNFGQQTPNQQHSQPQPQNRPPSQQQHHIQPQHLQQSPHQQQQQQPLPPSNQPTQHHQQQPHHPPQQSQPLQPPPPKPGELSTSSTDPNKARNNYFLTAADPAGLTSASDRLHKLLRAKYDAGMLKPFNYVRGYARLQSYMSRHLLPSSQRRILSQLSRFRPKFREAMQELTDMQLVLVEMWFERSLMEYDRVFASMAIPACCWRRTGEIFRGNREMAELIGVGMESLRDGRLAIHEVLEEESLVSYWEKFGAIAFDGSQKAILTSCSVKVPGDGSAEGDVGVSKGEGGGGGSARREGSWQLQGQQGQQQGKPEDSRISTTTTTTTTAEVQGKNASSSPLANKASGNNTTTSSTNHTAQDASGSNSNHNKGKESSDSGAPAAGGHQASGTSGSTGNGAGNNGGGGGANGGTGAATARTKKCCFSFTIRRDNHNM